MTSLPVSIPDGFDIVIEKGDAVAVGDILAKKIISDPEEIKPTLSEIKLQIADELEINPSRVRALLKKGPGDSLKAGDVIAERSYSFGLKSMKVISHISGTILTFDRVTGVLTVQTEDIQPVEDKQSKKEEAIYSPIEGQIKKINDTSIEIEGKGTGLVGTKGVGGVGSGQIVFIEGKEEKVMSTDISSECSGKILLVEGITREALAKAAAVDVAGIISTHLVDEDLTYIEEKRLPLPIIEVPEDIFKKLKKEKESVITMQGEMKLMTPSKE